MYHEIMQSISVLDDRVYTVCAVRDNSHSPMVFRRAERPELTDRYRQGGLHATLKSLWENVFLGKIILRPHNCRLTEHLKRANELIRQPLRFYLDADHAGEFIATVAENSYTDTLYSHVEELRKLEALRSDPEITLDICKNNPCAFHFSQDNVRQNRIYAERYIEQCASDPRFVYPSSFNADKELAMKALEHNGRLFVELDHTLRSDREVALLAYNGSHPRTFSAVNPADIEGVLLNNKDFLCQLCSICPDLAVQNTPFILRYSKVAEAWLRHNRHAFADMELLPRSVLKYLRVRKALYALADGDKERLAAVNLFIFQCYPTEDEPFETPLSNS